MAPFLIGVSIILCFCIFSKVSAWVISNHRVVPNRQTLLRPNAMRFDDMLGSDSKNIAILKRRKIVAGEVSPHREVPAHIIKPDYSVPQHIIDNERTILDEDSLIKMRNSCRIAREVLDSAVRIVRPGITTEAIDEHVHNLCIAKNSYPSPLDYHGYPKSCCTSVNEVMCHGIPDSTVLQEGDIINIDITIYHDGYHGDCSETVGVGKVTKEALKLMKITYDCMMAGINVCKAGVRISSIGDATEAIARKSGYTIAKDFAGHGIGKHFHCNPSVPNYAGSFATDCMEDGQIFTVEPIVCVGNGNKYKEWDDKWTHATADDSLSALYEHTILVKNGGVEMLTARLPDSPPLPWENQSLTD